MREQRDDNNDINLLVVGGKSTGKSALSVRFLTKRFIGEYDSHDDVVISRGICIADREIQIKIKDTTGMEWLTNAAYILNWASAVIVVFSITDRASFLIATDMLEMIHSIKPLSSSCTLLVGNKCDLRHLRDVPKREAKRLALDFGVRFVECSAAENFDDIHNSFTRLILEAVIVDQARKLSGELSSGSESSKKASIQLRKRSVSTPQPMKVPLRDIDSEKQDSFELMKSLSPVDQIREQHRLSHRRKHSLRRKISGIGSKLVGSQYAYK